MECQGGVFDCREINSVVYIVQKIMGRSCTPQLGAEIQKFPEETSRRSGDILRKFLHKTRAIPFISHDVVGWLLERARE